MNEHEVLNTIDNSKTKVFHYTPGEWCDETDKSLRSLITKGMIKNCNEDCQAMNSSYAYTRVELTTVIINSGQYSWLDASGESNVKSIL